MERTQIRTEYSSIIVSKYWNEKVRKTLTALSGKRHSALRQEYLPQVGVTFARNARTSSCSRPTHGTHYGTGRSAGRTPPPWAIQ
jgi:hypothetical protein